MCFRQGPRHEHIPKLRNNVGDRVGSTSVDKLAVGLIDHNNHLFARCRGDSHDVFMTEDSARRVIRGRKHDHLGRRSECCDDAIDVIGQVVE